MPSVAITPSPPPADVHVAASGRFLYASNRGDDTIAVFAIDQASGQLSPVQQVPSGGKAPRNFSLDPTARFWSRQTRNPTRSSASVSTPNPAA